MSTASGIPVLQGGEDVNETTATAGEHAPHLADNGATVTGLNGRSAILCRTCLRPITWETRTEPGFLPREGFYDDAQKDPLVCFKAANLNHEPLSDREWAYYEAGQKAGAKAAGDFLAESKKHYGIAAAIDIDRHFGIKDGQ